MVRLYGRREVPAGVIALLAGGTAGVLVVVGLGVAGVRLGGGHTHDHSGASPASSTAASAPGVSDPSFSPAPSVLPSATGNTAPLPTAAGLAAALRAPLGSAALGSRVGLVVVDPADGTTLYALDGGVPQAPASTAKLVTAASVLHFVGPNATLETRTVAGAQPGDVVLVGGGDPTITTHGGGSTYPKVASLDALAGATARSLKAAGTTRIHLVLDDSLFTGPRTGPGWMAADVANGLVARVSALTLDEDRVTPAGLPRYPDPTGHTGSVFKTLLARHGVAVTTTTRGTAPAQARQLAAVSSPPVSALVERTLLTSDNDLAEALAHLAGVAAHTGGSFAGGAAASDQTLAWLGVDATGDQLVDGSGISSRDRLTALTLAAVVRAAMQPEHFELGSLLSGLPVAGVSGSLADRFDTKRTAAARGRVRAKTGTLTGVSSLAGTVLDRDGRTLTFVVMADRTPPLTDAARAAIDRVAATLEACGCGG